MKQSLEKQLTPERSHNIKPDFIGAEFPPHSNPNSSKSHGNPIVELATPNGTNNLTEGTKKDGLKVKEGSPSK